MKLTTQQVDQLQEDWTKMGKACNHDKGWGIEQDGATGCKCDCFCVQCGMRHTSEDFFIQRMKKKSGEIE